MPTDDAIHTLLHCPPGHYGLSRYGNTYAVSLTGCSLFRERAFNLFSTFGGECNRGAWTESRPLIARHSDRPDTMWFALPRARVVSALTLYIYGQLVRAACQDVVDDEGDFVEVVCPDEEGLLARAAQDAETFVLGHMPTDYGAIPVNEWDDRGCVEYSLGTMVTDLA